MISGEEKCLVVGRLTLRASPIRQEGIVRMIQNGSSTNAQGERKKVDILVNEGDKDWHRSTWKNMRSESS